VSTCRIEITPTVRLTLLTLAKPTRRRIQNTIDGLAEQPRPQGTTKLSGAPDMLRLRAATHELIYTVREDVILIIDLAHRSSPWQQSHNNPNSPATAPLTAPLTAHRRTPPAAPPEAIA
jgi:mRNA interferase RelE/StbE